MNRIDGSKVTGRSSLSRIGLVALALFLAGSSLSAQGSLASQVLVVYAPDDPDSAAVGSYYANRRGIPASNLCPVWLPNSGATTLNTQEYETYIKYPVQACLNNAGANNILYIVLAYLRPYSISTGSGLGYYALDSYLADLWDQYTTQDFNPYPTQDQPYYADTQSQGNVYRPFRSLAAYRSGRSLPLIYSVWRLDGATPSLATALVDNALAAEASGGPISQVPGAPANACIDMVVDPSAYNDSGYRIADWDLLRASQLLSAVNRFNMILDGNGEVLGSPPAPACPNAALYAGWYNYGRYNDAFSWNPGSIGWDLNSGALADPRGGVWWGSNALLRGVTVTSGPVAEPYLEGLTRPNGVMFNLLGGANVGDAFLRNTRWLKWMILNVGDPLYTPFPGGLPPYDRPLPVNSLSLSPRQVVGGRARVSVVLTLAEPAPPEGLTINLSTDNSAFTVPPYITVPGGKSRITFWAKTSFVADDTDVKITAWIPSGSVSNTESLYRWLSDMRFSPNPVTGGTNVTATVFLNEKAPPGGATVQLWTDMPGFIFVPPTVSIPAGASQADFVIATSPVSDGLNVQVNASLAGGQITTALTIVP